MRWTAYKFEVKPMAYGTLHLTFFIIGLAVVIGLCLLLRRKNQRTLDWILFGTGAFLILTEIYKQLFYAYVIADGGYTWWIFPFQLCSIPMYLTVLLPFVKNEKSKQGIYDFLMSFSFLSGLIAFVEPSGILLEYAPLTFHSLTWHMTLVFIGLLIAMSGLGGKSRADFKGAVRVYLWLCFIAFTINVAVLTFIAPDSGINMFFVGPNNSSLVICKQICEKFGWAANAPVFIIASCFGALLFFNAIRGLRRLFARKNKPLPAAAVQKA